MKVLGAYLMPHPPIIIPDIGYGEEHKAAATVRAMHEVSKEIAAKRPQTIVMISPHGPLFTDAINIRATNPLCGTMAAFGAEQISLSKNNDLELMALILKKAYEAEIPSVKLDEALAKKFDLEESVDHGIIVPTYFIDQYYSDYNLLAINYGMLSEDALYQFGICIQEAAQQLEREIVVIASGDLSHHLVASETYPYRAEGQQFDKQVVEVLGKQDYASFMTMDETLVCEAGQCGKKAIEIMLGTLEGIGHQTNVVSYEGPFGVGYAIISFEPTLTATKQAPLLTNIKKAIEVQHQARLEREDDFVKLARLAIERYVSTQERLMLPESCHTPAFMSQSQGVFVSIKDRGGLRGCMGSTIGLELNLGNEIIATAIKAATQDPRFDPIETQELETLRISVDLLSPAELVTDIETLDPLKFGVIVSSDYKRGLLLPNLEGIHTISEQLRIACNKAGIRASESYEVYRFTVERHE